MRLRLLFGRFVAAGLVTSWFTAPALSQQLKNLEASAAKVAKILWTECFPDMERELEHHSITYRSEGSDTAEKLLLTQVPCNLAAYNTDQFWLLTSVPGETEILAFARPELAISYADDESTKVKSMAVEGFSASRLLPNSFYDAQAMSITAFSKWRGVGDASSLGHWQFREGTFVLRDYEVDASYDGEINTVPVMKDGKVLQ